MLRRYANSVFLCTCLLNGLGVDHNAIANLETNLTDEETDPQATQFSRAFDRSTFENYLADAKFNDDRSARSLAVFNVYLADVENLRIEATEYLGGGEYSELRTLAQELMPSDRPISISYNADGTSTDLGVSGSWAPESDHRWERLRELKADALNGIVLRRKRVQNLARTLFTDLQAILSETGPRHFTARQYFLMAWENNPRVTIEEFEFRHVDIIDIAQESLVDGVLSEFTQQILAQPFGDDRADEWRYAIRTIGSQYYSQVESVIAARFFHLPELTKPSEVIFSQPIDEINDLDRKLRRSGQRWKQRFTIDMAAAEEIASLIRERSLDEVVADVWMTEVRSAICPGLYKTRAEHTILERLDARDDFDFEQLSAAKVIQDDFLRDWFSLRRRAFDLGIAACGDAGQIWMERGTGRPHKRYSQLLVEMHVVASRSRDRLESLLVPSQIAAVRAIYDACPNGRSPFVLKRHLDVESKKVLDSAMSSE